MLGAQFCQAHFPGQQVLICTHPDGHTTAATFMCISSSTAGESRKYHFCPTWTDRTIRKCRCLPAILQSRSHGTVLPEGALPNRPLTRQQKTRNRPGVFGAETGTSKPPPCFHTKYSACFVVRIFQRCLPFGTQLFLQSVMCYTLCRRCYENGVAAEEGNHI